MTVMIWIIIILKTVICVAEIMFFYGCKIQIKWWYLTHFETFGWMIGDVSADFDGYLENPSTYNPRL